nr:hypothetical protein [Tanacetum cinerariifolium]
KKGGKPAINENHILRPSTIAIAKKFKELIQKNELTIADLEGAGLERIKVQYNNDVELEYHVCQLKATVLSEAQWNNDEGDVSKPISFERHMSKSTKPHPCFYNNEYSYLVDLNTEEKHTTSITKHYAARYYQEGIKDMIPERWSKEVRRYHFESLNGIHYWEEDIIDFFKAGMSAITEGNVYSDLRINQLSELLQRRNEIQENLIDMLSKNKLGNNNKRLKGRYWTDYDVKYSKEMLKKIDEILKHIEQLRRLEEYVGGRRKTVNPHTFVYSVNQHQYDPEPKYGFDTIEFLCPIAIMCSILL